LRLLPARRHVFVPSATSPAKHACASRPAAWRALHPSVYIAALLWACDLVECSPLRERRHPVNHHPLGLLFLTFLDDVRLYVSSSPPPSLCPLPPSARCSLLSVRCSRPPADSPNKRRGGRGMGLPLPVHPRLAHVGTVRDHGGRRPRVDPVFA